MVLFGKNLYSVLSFYCLFNFFSFGFASDGVLIVVAWSFGNSLVVWKYLLLVESESFDSRSGKSTF